MGSNDRALTQTRRTVARAAEVFGGVMFAFWSFPALAAGAQVFPVKPALVPMVVAAAFVLPAGAAGVWSVLRRSTGRVGTLASVAVFAIAAIGILAYANPELISVVRQSLSRF